MENDNKEKKYKDNHRKDSSLYLLKKPRGRPKKYRESAARNFVIKKVMAGRSYIKISEYTLGAIIDAYDVERMRIEKMKRLDEELFS